MTTEISLWQRVGQQLDPLLLRPRVRPNVFVRRLETSDHRPYFMAKSPDAGTYIRLNEREHDLLALMDGDRTVKQIVMADFVAHKSLAFNRVIQLVMLLHAQSFLVDRSIPTYHLVRQQLKATSPARRRLQTFSDIIFGRQISLNGIDGFVTAVYRLGGWLLFTPPVLLLLLLSAVAGLVAFETGGGAGSSLGALLSGDTKLLGAAAFALFLVLSIFIHEMAHALTCKRFGREVRRGGVMLFFGFPAVFVDTSDIWLESRWKRIAVSAAGAVADATVAGICALLALVLPPDGATFSRAFAAMTYGIVVINLFPLLELDGYYVLQELVEVPNLRPRAINFVRDTLWTKLRARRRFTREEIILAIFGLLTVAYMAFFLYRLVQFWNSSAVHFVEEAFASGNVGSMAAAILAIALVVVAVGVKLLSLGHRAANVADRGARVLLRAARRAQLRPRGRLLAGIPMLADLPPVQLEEISRATRPGRYRQGSTIIREGERGDRFFLVASGMADVIHERRQGAQPLAVLGPGDYFGELALLNDEPRRASVRAVTDLETLELSKADFERLVSPTWHLKERMRHAVDLRSELDQVPLFADLSPSERDLLLAHLEEERFESGENIVLQGEPGDAFYVIREGEVRVVREEPGRSPRDLARLGPGDFFGEHALLFEEPRDATVVCETPVVTWRLQRQDFDDILLRYLKHDDAIESTARDRERATALRFRSGTTSGFLAVQAEPA